MTAVADTPRVSVCVPVRDGAEHLGTALASALAQDVEGLEVVVADDASSDATAAVVAAIEDPRVRYVRHEQRVGVAANRNACLAAARGAYVAWLDADDEYLPGALARQVAVLDAHPDVVLVHGAYDVVDGSGRRLPSWPLPHDEDVIEPSAAAFRHLITANEMATSTVVVRRSAHDEAGPFATEIGASSTDWDMWLRVALRGDVAYTAQRVARYRQHRRTISRATSFSGERLRCDLRVAARVLREERPRIADADGALAAAEAALAAKAVLQAGDAYTRGRHADALDALAIAGRLAPSTPVHDLMGATVRGDDVACQRLTKAALDRLADRLDGTRFGAKVRRAAATDAAWDAQLEAVAAVVADVTPSYAVIAAIAKWDPTIVARSGRAGCNYPDRELLPDGYPADGQEAVRHLEAVVAHRGVTHLVIPAVSAWWLEHYPELALHLGAPVHADAGCSIFDVRGRL